MAIHWASQMDSVFFQAVQKNRIKLKPKAHFEKKTQAPISNYEFSSVINNYYQLSFESPDEVLFSERRQS